MADVFLSWVDGHLQPRASALRTALEARGLSVDHSPFSPGSAIRDERWPTWYESGLATAVDSSRAFVLVLTNTFAAGWIGMEIAAAYRAHRTNGLPLIFLFLADSISLPASLSRYGRAIRELPDDPDSAAETIFRAATQYRKSTKD